MYSYIFRGGGGGGGGGERQSPLEANQECDLAPPYFKLQNNIICKIRRWDGSCWVLTLVSSRQTFTPLGHSSHFFSFAFFYIHSVSSIWIFSAWHAFPVSCLVALFFTHVCMLYTYSRLFRSKPLSLLPHRVQATRAVYIYVFFCGCNLFFPRGELSNPFFCCVQPTILLVKLYTRRERIRYIYIYIYAHALCFGVSFFVCIYILAFLSFFPFLSFNRFPFSPPPPFFLSLYKVSSFFHFFHFSRQSIPMIASFISMITPSKARFKNDIIHIKHSTFFT